MTVVSRHLSRLVTAARGAVAKAFVTSPGSTAYGAAALSVTGRIYSSGQYSSYNHVTNVHAEQAALLMATMSGDPVVVALAVASNKNRSVVRPCGVCRQVLVEHALRSGADIEIIMVQTPGQDHEVLMLSQLLPHSWEPISIGSDKTDNPPAVRCGSIESVRSLSDYIPRIGDHVELVSGSIAMVWDDLFLPDRMLVKIKYGPEMESGRAKIQASFSSPRDYQRRIYDLGLSRYLKLGGGVAIPRKDIVGIIPAPALPDSEKTIPTIIRDALVEAGISDSSVRVTGSRSIGLQTEKSDWDLIVPASKESITRFRSELFRGYVRGAIEIPTRSGTWKIMDRIFPGGCQGIIDGQRFIDTISIDGTSFSFIFVPEQRHNVLLEKDWKNIGHDAMHGVVTDISQSGFKRAVYVLKDDLGTSVRINCYHKLANLLQVGDIVSVRGSWVCLGGERQMVQLYREPDSIVWF